MKKQKRNKGLDYWEWAETRPVSYLLTHGVVVWLGLQLVHWILFVKLGF